MFRRALREVLLVRMSARTMHYLEACPEERPVGAQLYGSNPSVLAEAARRVHT